MTAMWPPRGYVNPGYDPARVPTDGPWTHAAPAFHRTLPGYAPTPLHRLPAEVVGAGAGRVLVKDESDRFGLPAFKILGASWAVEQTLRQYPHTTTLVAASAGNHGRAVARCAADRGLSCRIYLPAGTSAASIDAIAAEGARVVTVDGDYDDAVDRAAGSADQRGSALIADFSRLPDEPSQRWVVEGYATLFDEVTAEFPEPVDVVVVPLGVGSLAAAAVLWAVTRDPVVRVVGVEPTAAPCVTASLAAGRPVSVPTGETSMTGLNCGTPATPTWPVIQHGLAATVVVDDADIEPARRVLDDHGVALGPCGAATVAAARRLTLEAAERGGRPVLAPGSRILLLGTEGPPVRR